MAKSIDIELANDENGIALARRARFVVYDNYIDLRIEEKYKDYWVTDDDLSVSIDDFLRIADAIERIKKMLVLA